MMIGKTPNKTSLLNRAITIATFGAMFAAFGLTLSSCQALLKAKVKSKGGDRSAEPTNTVPNPVANNGGSAAPDFSVTGDDVIKLVRTGDTVAINLSFSLLGEDSVSRVVLAEDRDGQGFGEESPVP